MEMIFIDGRYPHDKMAVVNKKQMILEVSSEEDLVNFRLDDGDNLDFWLAFTISKVKLQKLLNGEEDG